jgi:6-phosphogluconolactonase
MTSNPDIHRVDDPKQAAAAALVIVLEQAQAAIAQRGRFVLALSGGNTPRQLYRLLAAQDLDWSQWHLVYGDERCLPKGDAERTSTLVEKSWLHIAGFPAANHHVPPAELGAQKAAEQYSKTLSPLLPIDVALLGMGEDGHTASLFPGHSHPDHRVLAVHNAPKPPSERVSLSYNTLCDARIILFMVTGEAKRDAVEDWLQGGDLPVARVTGTDATILITDIA